MEKAIIPIFRPDMGDLEISNVTEVMRSGWIGLGPKTQEFEEKFAKKIGVKYAVALNSATAALDLAIRVNEVKDAEVIVPALTFISTALAPLYSNNKIVFADIDEETLCIDWNDVKKKITPKTKAVIPVWYGGRYIAPPKLPSYVTIIEDCAHAMGTREAGVDNMACWSFHAVKNIATADGGMITTNDESLYRKLQPLRWCGIDRSTWERAQKKYGWDYSIETVGYKCHMNDLIASIGLAQLSRIDELNRTRRLRVLEYIEELRHLSWLKLPKYTPHSSWHLFVIRMEERNRFIDYMLAHGISVGVHYKPLNLYPMFPQTPLPVTDRVWKQLVTLPLFPSLSDEEMEQIIKTIKKFK